MELFSSNTPVEQPEADQTPRKKVNLQSFRKVVWQGKIFPAFWSIGSLLSLVLNIILIVALVLVGKEFFTFKELITDQLLRGLYYNFIMMDEAEINTSVQVDDTIPVQFDLPVNTNTTVTLSENTYIYNAQVGVLSAPTNIVLPEGTKLPITLDIIVPVDTTVPVVLDVPVNIPLSETELHIPFVGLQDVVSPYYSLLYLPPYTWEGWLCDAGLTFLCPK
jgi:hypothetical protein